jgi:hypothetical protein
MFAFPRVYNLAVGDTQYGVVTSYSPSSYLQGFKVSICLLDQINKIDSLEAKLLTREEGEMEKRR